MMPATTGVTSPAAEKSLSGHRAAVRRGPGLGRRVLLVAAGLVAWVFLYRALEPFSRLSLIHI